ncbi:restriction endonuclease [Paenibacillus sp. NPDC057934]|uniref:restriction endonuclease n=1 Tax=Paenibacillus sp. NPDC057934 TaxID=3346282 RepID=UPI0036DBD9E7
MSKRMWLVRAGQGAYLLNEFKEKQAVAIGWGELGDLSNLSSLQELKTLLRSGYSDYKEGTVNINAGQIYRFASEFQVNDEVITYDPEKRLYYIGSILSEYVYNPDFITDSPHFRKVNWKGSVLRDHLSAGARNTLGSIMTIILIPDEVRSEVYSHMGQQSEPAGTEVEEGIDELEIIKADVIAKSNEFIKDRISNLDWKQMQELVAGILRGMGYKTRISPEGPDRGRDIQASPDGLGLEEPRIIVEVKHRKGQMGSNEIRSFTGGLRTGDRGIYVSTGGFSKEAKYEAERSNIPMSLVDSNLLMELVIQYYDQFDSDTRALVPLKKIYWPV